MLGAARRPAGLLLAVPIVFDQEIHVDYGQFYVESRTDEFFEGFTELGGQAKRLCGAAVPGLLFLTDCTPATRGSPSKCSTPRTDRR